MKKYIDSKIIELNNEKYLAYLKSVPVRESKAGEVKLIVRAFVKRLRKSRKKKLGIIRRYVKQFSYS